MTDPSLSAQRCKPCTKGTPPLPVAEVGRLLGGVSQWRLIGEGKALAREFQMRDFLSAVALIRDVAAIAEAEDHHPDVHLTGYRNLQFVLSTHAIGGLSTNDFILAAKIDAALKHLKA